MASVACGEGLGGLAVTGVNSLAAGPRQAGLGELGGPGGWEGGLREPTGYLPIGLKVYFGIFTTGAVVLGGR